MPLPAAGVDTVTSITVLPPGQGGRRYDLHYG